MTGLKFIAVAAMVAVGGCGTTASETLSAGETTAELANPALMPGVEAVQDEAARDHLTQWHRAHRAPGSTFALARLYAPGEATTVLINQRVDSGEPETCRVLVHKVVLPHDPSTETTGAQVGVSCCDGVACQLDAGGSMLALERALKSHDKAALAALVSPRGVAITLSEANPSAGLVTAELTVSADEVAAKGLEGITTFDTLRYDTQCDARGDAIECSCTTAGVQQRWRWARGEQGLLKLTAVDEDGD